MHSIYSQPSELMTHACTSTHTHTRLVHQKDTIAVRHNWLSSYVVLHSPFQFHARCFNFFSMIINYGNNIIND